MEEYALLDLKMRSLQTKIDNHLQHHHPDMAQVSLAEYEKTYDEAQICIREWVIDDDDIAISKKQLLSHRKMIKQFRTDIKGLQRQLLITNNQSTDSQTEMSTIDGMINHGNKVLSQSKASLVRTVQTIQDAREIGIDINNKLEQQTQQTERMYDHIDSIDSTLGRSTKILKRMARKMLTDKYLWCVITLVLGAIIFIIIAPKLGFKFNSSNSTTQNTNTQSNNTSTIIISHILL